MRRIIAASDEHLWVLSTLALSTMVQEAMAIWWGTDPTPFPRVFRQDLPAAFDQKFWLPIDSGRPDGGGAGAVLPPTR